MITAAYATWRRAGTSDQPTDETGDCPHAGPFQIAAAGLAGEQEVQVNEVVDAWVADVEHYRSIHGLTSGWRGQTDTPVEGKDDLAARCGV